MLLSPPAAGSSGVVYFSQEYAYKDAPESGKGGELLSYLADEILGKQGARGQSPSTLPATQPGGRYGSQTQIKLVIPAQSVMGSVITVESLDELGLEVGDDVMLFVKAVNVLPVKTE